MLREMRELAERARDNDLTQAEAREVNARLQELEKEVRALDAGSRGFWMDCFCSPTKDVSGVIAVRERQN
ncbi:MAG: hypothetical protein JG764_560 [Clostridiales bacterium]|jgi:hypothetical protein|nr:hypothetical protein [Clostridiales bacterium]